MFKKEGLQERKEFNKELYRKIFAITNNPEKILDLGCGLNPLMFPFKNIYYIACDEDKEALKKVKKHFKKNKIKGNVFYCDLNDNDNLKDIEPVDIALLFKVLDTFSRKRKVVKKILERLNSKWIVVSFPTRTINGKRMNNPKRIWFEKMIRAYKYKKIKYFNEVFYVVFNRAWTRKEID